ncbi:class I SAM-dependent methyltransferase [Actinomadura atramentaria]|uniref:class I SAM-dependent methyltransferase n=1 Tax=Actinomadura atramentaria TaxID=1990 RepID=UPI0003676A3A|nr:class I SAM-dependent methyltransferase [Actinomadura atramentaria]
MARPALTARTPGRSTTSELRRLLEFAAPLPGEVCLDVSCGPGPLAAALRPRVRHVTAVDAAPPPHGANGVAHPGEDGDGPVGVRAVATALPYRDGAFSLVTTRWSLSSLGEPVAVLRELLRVCRPGGRVVVAELVRGRLTASGHAAAGPTVTALTELVAAAGGTIGRLDAFAAERPLEPWLDRADPAVADRIRASLISEVDGGPATGARPRVIGGELWFTQSWAHVALRRR